MELRFITTKNKHIWVNALCTPVIKDKKTIRLTGTFQDITERKKVEEELKNIFKLSPDMIAVCTAEGKLLKINPPWEKVLGYTQIELLELGWATLVHPDDVERTNKEVERQLKGSRVVNFINRYKCKNGSYKILEWQATYAQDGIVYSTARDITERKRIEEKLKDSERKSHAWLENSSVCTKVVDPEFNLKYMSASGIKALNIDDITQFYGKPYPSDFYSDSFNSVMTKNLERVKDTGETITQEASVVNLNGNELWFHSTLVPVNDDKGQLDYIMILSVDITERKLAENALHESEKKHRGLIENLPQMIFHKDADLVYVSCNKHFAHALGITPEEIEGKTDFDFQPTMLAEKYRADDRRLMESGQTEEIEEIFIKDGKKLFVQTVKTPLTDDSGNVTGILGIFWDITDRKRAEFTLQESERKFKYLFDNALVAVAISDTEGKAILGNEIMHKMFGYSKQEMQDLKVSELYKNPADKDDFINALRKNGQVENCEVEYINRNGQSFWVMMTAKFIMFEGKKAILSTGIDITDKKNARIKLDETHSNLIREQVKLRAKNSALNEVLNQIEDDKKRIAFQIRSNIDKIIMPILRRLDAKVGPTEKNDILLLQSSLEQVTIPFVSELESLYGRLTPREVEVCNMIKSGLSSKEIASTLNTSWETVRNQRKHVRKKLGITGEKRSLISILKST